MRCIPVTLLGPDFMTKCIPTRIKKWRGESHLRRTMVGNEGRHRGSTIRQRSSNWLAMARCC